MIIQTGSLNHELEFSFSKSSGPGGQHVNKTNTKVELRFSIDKSKGLSLEQKELIRLKLHSKINNEDELLIVSQENRSQVQNKNLAIDKFYSLINQALTPRKRRLRSQKTAASKEKRLKKKKERSEIKSRRKWDY